MANEDIVTTLTSRAAACKTALGIVTASITGVATARFLGRTTSGTGTAEELTATQATAILNVATSALKGLAPASGGGTTNYLRADLTWAAPAGGGGGASALDDLSDVVITTATDGDVIYRASGTFVNSPLAELIDDRVGALVVAGTGISATYNDGAGSLTIAQTAAGNPEVVMFAVSDETTALTTGTAKITFRMPYAMTLTAIRGSLSTAQTSGSILTVDVNEGGSSILSTKLTIDNTEKTSTTAATAAVISDTSLADDAEITVDIDQVGDGTAKGLKVALIGTRT